MRMFFASHRAALALWMLAASLLAFCQMGFDKRRAKTGGWRVRERTLWLTALLGGGPGALLGMGVFRHKTRHAAFRIGFPLLAALDAALLAWSWLG